MSLPVGAARASIEPVHRLRLHRATIRAVSYVLAMALVAGLVSPALAAEKDLAQAAAPYVWHPEPPPSYAIAQPAPAATPECSRPNWPFWTAAGAVVLTGMILGYLYLRQDKDLAMPNTTFGTKQF
jgi:hypothetical protein